jgi:glutaredoxin 3
MNKYIKVNDNKIRVERTETQVFTYDYDFLISQRRTLQDQKDKFNKQKDAEIKSITELINECDKLGIVPVEIKINKQSKIRVFVTQSCPYCSTLKEFLTEKGIEFEELDVSKDNNLFIEMKEKSKQENVPVIDIDGQIIVGFDLVKLTEITSKIWK